MLQWKSVSKTLVSIGNHIEIPGTGYTHTWKQPWKRKIHWLHFMLGLPIHVFDGQTDLNVVNLIGSLLCSETNYVFSILQKCPSQKTCLVNICKTCHMGRNYSVLYAPLVTV